MSDQPIGAIRESTDLLTAHIRELTASPHTSCSILTPGSRFNLLLALSDDALSEAAIRMTNIFAFERGALPAVVQIVDPTPYAPPALAPSLSVFAESLLGPDMADVHRQNLRQRLSNMCGHPVTWSIKTLFGTPSDCIINEVRRRHSQMVVLGLHAYGHACRLLGSETTLRILESVPSTVLAVTPSFKDLPDKILVATDFSRSSIRAAILAARFVTPGGMLTLAYVRTPDTPIEETIHWGDNSERDGVFAVLSELAREISEFGQVHVTVRCLDGDPAEGILQYAESTKPDLIAMGSQRHTLYQKHAVGRVPQKVASDGRWSVLVVPPQIT